MQKSKPILTDKQQTPLSSVYGTTVHENIPSPKSQIPEIQEDENISENPNTTTTTTTTTTSTDIPQVAQAPIPSTEISLQEYERQVEENLAQYTRNNMRKSQKTNNDVSLGNETNEPPRDLPVSEPIVFYHPPNLGAHAKVAETVITSVSTSVLEIADKMNIEVKQSQELAQELKKDVKELDTWLNSLPKMSWVNFFKVSATVLTIGAFLWKMGALRSVPYLASNLITAVPMPKLDISKLGNVTPSSVPLPKPETTIQTLMETPLTPFGLVAFTGTLTLAVGSLKVLAWVLRKTPK